jgi:hypothetical protein
MDELTKKLDEAIKEVEDFCLKTLAEIAVMRIQVNLLKEAYKK